MASSAPTVFTLTFTLEVLNSNIWEDHKEGWIELGNCLQVIKFRYNLYPNKAFGIDVEIWPYAAKIVAGDSYCWVRTWQFLERRWLSFSIRHDITVRVREMMGFTADVTLATSSGVSSTPKVLFPPLPFGVRRYFGPVKENEDDLEKELKRNIEEWIWNPVKEYIPPSFVDGTFNEPHPVSDLRHQDTLLYHVQNLTLNMNQMKKDVTDNSRDKSNAGANDTLPNKSNIGAKLSSPTKSIVKTPLEVFLPGDTILAGTGRVVPFYVNGDLPIGVGDMVILLSSANLPAADDDPIVFINVNKLFDVPLEELRKLRVTDLYTRWRLGEKEHNSKLFNIESKDVTEVLFDDHHTIPLEPNKVNETTAVFLDSPFSIQLRGKRSLSDPEIKPKLFGFGRKDHLYDVAAPTNTKKRETDFLVAVTKIDAISLAKGFCGYINGEYPLFPPTPTVPPGERSVTCTNDINLIGLPFKPEIVVPVSLVLSAQMTLEVSVGIVGCKAPRLALCFSRLYCLMSDSTSAMRMIAEVRKINDELANTKPETMLTGFAVDTGDLVVLFLEGPRDGNILKIWEISEEFYPKIKPVFNSSSRYSNRIYEEFLQEILPFRVLKMYVPLGVLLACSTVYVRPALPNPARIAALKFGRLIQYKYRHMPAHCDLPMASELKSFALELCAPLRSLAVPAERTRSKAPEKESLQLESKKKIEGSHYKLNDIPEQVNAHSIEEEVL